MIVGNIENGLERGFVKHCLNYVLIIDPMCFSCKCDDSKILALVVILKFEIT